VNENVWILEHCTEKQKYQFTISVNYIVLLDILEHCFTKKKKIPFGPWPKKKDRAKRVMKN
jgi:hypothetical protein